MLSVIINQQCHSSVCVFPNKQRNWEKRFSHHLCVRVCRVWVHLMADAWRNVHSPVHLFMSPLLLLLLPLPPPPPPPPPLPLCPCACAAERSGSRCCSREWRSDSSLWQWDTGHILLAVPEKRWAWLWPFIRHKEAETQRKTQTKLQNIHMLNVGATCAAVINLSEHVQGFISFFQLIVVGALVSRTFDPTIRACSSLCRLSDSQLWVCGPSGRNDSDSWRSDISSSPTASVEPNFWRHFVQMCWKLNRQFASWWF